MAANIRRSDLLLIVLMEKWRPENFRNTLTLFLIYPCLSLVPLPQEGQCLNPIPSSSLRYPTCFLWDKITLDPTLQPQTKDKMERKYREKCLELRRPFI